jgi:hypothetical protein
VSSAAGRRLFFDGDRDVVRTDALAYVISQ